jgi:hypothetical protein
LIIEAFLIALLASAIVAVTYGALFAQREQKIRGYLSTKRQGWVRSRYVKAFVGGVRGHAAAVDTLMMGGLVLIIPFVVAMILWYMAADVALKVDIADIRFTQVTQKLQDLKEARTDTLESLEADLSRVRGEVDALRQSGERFVLRARVAGIMSFGVCLCGAFFWLPFAVTRRQFAYEIDRFTLRIQGLASKAELAELAMAESQVADEGSLRAFVRVAAAIAARHEVPGLVARFDLWAGPKDSVGAA